jgi:hypothetical protein
MSSQGVGNQPVIRWRKWPPIYQRTIGAKLSNKETFLNKVDIYAPSHTAIFVDQSLS